MKKSSKAFRRIEPYLYLLPSSLLIVFMLGYPISYNIIISFFDWTLKNSEKTFNGLDNYIKILTDDKFFPILQNTLVWTILGVLLQMVVGIGLALVVDHMTRGKKYLRTIALIPWLIPGVVTALTWKWMLLSDIGIINFFLKLIGVTDANVLFMSDPKIALFTLIFVNLWKASPFWFLMITAGLQNKPIDQIESAKLEGAKSYHVLRHVILPHLSPVITSTGILTTIWTLNYFDLIWVTTKGGPMDATTTLPIYTYRMAFEFNNFGGSAALAVISLILVSLVCIPYLKKMFGDLKEQGVL
ncbi:MAG: sugar ABC transporter permease [Lachnospiraceae bacterium]|jgi:multiple sugar transport system permease protein|nr:sugar ABC transporter permease [Lachnospiraceae bacterium]